MDTKKNEMMEKAFSIWESEREYGKPARETDSKAERKRKEADDHVREVQFKAPLARICHRAALLSLSLSQQGHGHLQSTVHLQPVMGGTQAGKKKSKARSKREK